MNARDNILARLRAAPRGEDAPPPDVGAWFAARRSGDALRDLENFRAQITAARAEVHDTTDADWPALFCQLLAAKGLRRVLIGNLVPHGERFAEVAGSGVDILRYTEPAERWREDFFSATDASLTLARCALADTGSLVLWPDAREPRMMSLVPPVHFVLLDARAIRPDLHAAMHAERWAEGMPTNALVISGPSKTADIQQTLAYGAHGPRELVVLIRHEGGAA